SRRRHTRSKRDWSSDVCSSDLTLTAMAKTKGEARWGFEATIVAGVIADQGPHRQPHLIHAMSMDRPGHNPAVRALEAIRHLMGEIGRASCRERASIEEGAGDSQ